MNQDNLYPTFDRMLGRRDKERLLRQCGLVVWLYGLSGSGKSTIAIGLERRLHEAGVYTQVLDGDNIRTGLNRNLGFSDEERIENIRRIAEVAKLFLSAGCVTLTSFICPKRELRALARETIGEADFVEVFVNASFETCAKRDVKGLYAKAASGAVKHFTGKDSSFEEPLGNEPGLITLDTEAQSVEESIQLLYEAVIQRVALDKTNHAGRHNEV